MSRLPNIQPKDFSEAQQKVFENIIGGKRGQGSDLATYLNAEGGLRGPFNAYLFNPTVGDAAQQLGAALRFEGNLPSTLREVAILTVGAKWQAQYEWWAHEKIALEVGVDPRLIAGIKAGVLPDTATPDEVTVHSLAQELINHHHVSDEQYKEAVDLLGESNVVELVILLGYYTLISMTLNTFKIPIPEGEELPFQQK
ncbi:MAG: carboxymuconolactone decarboxylase family protein [Chloroflexota bacterium]